MSSLLFFVWFAVVAAAYGSIGLGGASGYLALLAAVDAPPDVMRPTALVLSMLVSGIAAWRFGRAGYLSWPLLWPFLVGGVPAAFIGTNVDVPAGAYNQLVGMALVATATRLALRLDPNDSEIPRRLPVPVAVAVGAALGLFKGMVGVGAIYLGPILLLTRWATFRQTGAATAAFIFITSAVSIAGQPSSLRDLPPVFPAWVVAVVLGGLVGSELSVRHFHRLVFRRVLAGALLLTAWKLFVP